MEVKNTIKETLDQWIAALTPALQKAGLKVTCSVLNNGGSRIALMHVRPPDSACAYVITFTRTSKAFAGSRDISCKASVHNPSAERTVSFEKFSAKAVEKIAHYAKYTLDCKLLDEAQLNKERIRTDEGVALYEKTIGSGFPIPAWAIISPNVKETEVGTFRLHVANSQPTKKLNPDQLKAALLFLTALETGTTPCTPDMAELLFALEAALPFVKSHVGTRLCSSAGGPAAITALLKKYSWATRRADFVPKPDEPDLEKMT